MLICNNMHTMSLHLLLRKYHAHHFHCGSQASDSTSSSDLHASLRAQGPIAARFGPGSWKWCLNMFKPLPGWWFEPLRKIWVRQLGWLFPMYGKQQVPNHQAVTFCIDVEDPMEILEENVFNIHVRTKGLQEKPDEGRDDHGRPLEHGQSRMGDQKLPGTDTACLRYEHGRSTSNSNQVSFVFFFGHFSMRFGRWTQIFVVCLYNPQQTHN